MKRPGKGDTCNLLRKTFLHKGVFVISGSPVVIMEEKADGFVVEYRDKEGLVHYIEGIQVSELQ
ncbi:MAG: hypothetical protein HS115_13000 [Spirochaetales bacterium]|nr:hypothetical protein [Spirochaetales bacterium]